jgi:hypothetical protein
MIGITQANRVFISPALPQATGSGSRRDSAGSATKRVPSVGMTATSASRALRDSCGAVVDARHGTKAGFQTR